MQARREGRPIDLAPVDEYLRNPPCVGDVVERVGVEHHEVGALVARDDPLILQHTVAKLAKAGAKIALGSDTGIQDHPFGITDHRELELLVEAGMTPMQTLVAATSTSAAYLELADQGALAAGKRANFMVLDANPLDDITNTRRIAAVYVNGHQVDRGALAQRLH